MLWIGINGACGRMGRHVIEAADQMEDVSVSCAVEAAGHPLIGQDAGAFMGHKLGVEVGARLKEPVDVVIDFSNPEGAVAILNQCVAMNVPAVICTTGLGPDQMKHIESAAGSIACIASPNMSVGANMLALLAPVMARALGPDYDIEIVESHHRFKADAPSGTAMKIAREINAASGEGLDTVLVHGRSGRPGPRRPGEIGMHAVRHGDVVGEHTVIFGAIGEQVELVHKVHTRAAFALGAIKAARFLKGKPPGIYDINDALDLKLDRRRRDRKED